MEGGKGGKISLWRRHRSHYFERKRIHAVNSGSDELYKYPPIEAWKAALEFAKCYLSSEGQDRLDKIKGEGARAVDCWYDPLSVYSELLIRVRFALDENWWVCSKRLLHSTVNLILKQEWQRAESGDSRI